MKTSLQSAQRCGLFDATAHIANENGMEYNDEILKAATTYGDHNFQWKKDWNLTLLVYFFQKGLEVVVKRYAVVFTSDPHVIVSIEIFLTDDRHLSGSSVQTHFKK